MTSVTCVPVPEKELKDWDDLNVSTILVGNRQNRNLVLNPSFEWWGFGTRPGAGVTLLWTNKNPEDKDGLVLEGLKKCLRPLVQPQLLPPKENNP